MRAAMGRRSGRARQTIPANMYETSKPPGARGNMRCGGTWAYVSTGRAGQFCSCEVELHDGAFDDTA
eukprot:691157-Pleurochrysis_carterae.AAC.1